MGKGDGVYKDCKVGLELVKHIFFDCPKAIVSWRGTANFHDLASLRLTVLAAGNLINLIDGALPIHPLLVAHLFIIHQMLWEIWLICNRMVFQKCFICFLVAKVMILVTEKMDAIDREALPNKRMIQIKRAHLFFRTPKERREELGQDEGFYWGGSKNLDGQELDWVFSLSAYCYQVGCEKGLKPKCCDKGDTWGS